MSETYFDDYSFVSGSIPTGTLDNTNITSTNFITSYNTSPDYAQQPTQSNRIRGSVTGSKKLVLNSSPATWLYSVNIYDDHNRVIQSKQTNYTTGTDVATVQYGFSGRVLRSHLAHQFVTTTTLNHTLLTKYSYDHVGRLKTIVKNIDGKGDKTTLQNTYNELGQLTTKILGSSLETQNYSYNIRGWLLGINKTYTETAASTSNYFGEALFYDFGFTNTQINGNIAGAKWKGAGDGIQRAYGFGYDNSNRLTKADFTQQNDGSTSWTSDKMDFSVSGLSYDANGNILSMKQRGVAINTPTTIDSLTYQYFTNSNQLQKVSDGITDMGPWGDFKDTALSADDYVYDVNGNIVKDNNKHIHTSVGGNGITYNFLDKATSITVNGKGTIAYTYDAGGMLLQKTTTDTKTNIKTVTTYVTGFVYQKTMASATSPGTVPDTLQYALHEEGRIRNALKKNSSTGAMYYALEYDYFLKDHLGNIRTVITEGKDTAVYVATMEAANQTTEQAFFDNEYDPVNTVVAKPVGFDTNGGNTQVTKLNSATGTNKPTGPGLLLKVMAGDKIQMSTYVWYNTAVQPPGGANPFTDLLSVLTGSVIGNSGGKLTTGLTTSVSNAISPNLTSFINNRAYNSSRPKAYLNWILLDEQMNYVSAGSNATQIPTVTGGAAKQAVAPALQTMPKSGYLYVYVSNESTQDVYFDDITVQHFTGPLVSEESYYAFGESMAALKSNAALKTQNCYKFNAGTELNESFDVDYYETAFRNYDTQIGRFTGIDAMAEKTMHLTPYQFGGNNPATYNDPTGLLQQREDQMDEGASGYGNWDDVGNSFNEMDQELDFQAGVTEWSKMAKNSLFWDGVLAKANASKYGGHGDGSGNFIEASPDGNTDHKIVINGTTHYTGTKQYVPILELDNAPFDAIVNTEIPAPSDLIIHRPFGPIKLDLKNLPGYDADKDAYMISFGANAALLSAGGGISGSVVIINKGNDQGIYVYGSPEYHVGLAAGVGVLAGPIFFNYETKQSLTRNTFTGFSDGVSFGLGSLGWTTVNSYVNGQDGQLTYSGLLAPFYSNSKIEFGFTKYWANSYLMVSIPFH